MDPKTNSVGYLNQLLSSYDEVIEDYTTNIISETPKAVHVKYQEVAYDLIDKDLDYDEQHHKHLLESLYESIVNVGKTGLRSHEIDQMNVDVAHRYMGSNVRKVRATTLKRSEEYPDSLELTERIFLSK